MVTGGRLLAGLAQTAGSAYSFAIRVPVVGGVVQRRTEDVVALGERSLDVAIALARATLKVVIREVIEALVVEVDLTELVRRHVDLNRIATEIDVDTIAARIDVDTIAARIDIDAILNRVDIDRVIETVDLDRAVARVDIDAIAAKIDIEPIIGRIDLIELANEIIDGVDLQAIVRDSTTTLTTGVLEDVRTQGARADDAVAGVIGRLLGRQATSRNGRGAGGAGSPAALNGHPADVVIEVHRRSEPPPPPTGSSATDRAPTDASTNGAPSSERPVDPA
jgi:hypothetical protein